MANRVILSEQFKLNARDFIKGCIIAVIAAVVPVIQSTIDQGELTFNWKVIGVTASSAFLAYIVKNFLDPATVSTTYQSNKKATEVANDLKQ